MCPAELWGMDPKPLSESTLWCYRILFLQSQQGYTQVGWRFLWQSKVPWKWLSVFICTQKDLWWCWYLFSLPLLACIAFLCSGDAKEMQPDWPPAGHLKETSWERLKVVSDFELSPCNPLHWVTIWGWDFWASPWAFVSLWWWENCRALGNQQLCLKKIVTTSKVTWTTLSIQIFQGGFFPF